jgi:hypothetical protein
MDDQHLAAGISEARQGMWHPNRFGSHTRRQDHRSWSQPPRPSEGARYCTVRWTRWRPRLTLFEKTSLLRGFTAPVLIYSIPVNG